MEQGHRRSRLSPVAASFRDVISVAQLTALGVPSNTAYRRCGPHGPWRRLLPGIVVLHNGPVTRSQHIAAALLYAGPDAVITGATACGLHEVRSVADDRVHVLIPATQRRQSHAMVRVERTVHMPRPARLSGFPVAPITRAAIDACRSWIGLDASRELIADVLQRRGSTVAELVRELEAASRRGTAIPRRVLSELAGGAHSVAELQAQRLWKRAGLPNAVWNRRLFTVDGRYVATPDAWCLEAAFAWEIDSMSHHSSVQGFARTVARNSRYAAAGVTVLQTLPTRLRDEPEAVIDELRSACAAAQLRPRPAVVLREAAA